MAHKKGKGITRRKSRFANIVTIKRKPKVKRGGGSRYSSTRKTKYYHKRRLIV